MPAVSPVGAPPRTRFGTSQDAGSDQVSGDGLVDAVDELAGAADLGRRPPGIGQGREQVVSIQRVGVEGEASRGAVLEDGAPLGQRVAEEIERSSLSTTSSSAPAAVLDAVG